MPRRTNRPSRQPDLQQSQNNLTTALLLNHACHVELRGNQEALVEGCMGIIEYNPTIIRLNTEKFILKFTGRNLQLNCMTEESILVKGFILCVEYL